MKKPVPWVYELVVSWLCAFVALASTCSQCEGFLYWNHGECAVGFYSPEEEVWKEGKRRRGMEEEVEGEGEGKRERVVDVYKPLLGN